MPEKPDALREIEEALQGAEWATAFDSVSRGKVKRALSLLPRLRAVVEAAREVEASPCTFNDERVDYVEVQVNRVDLMRLKDALAALDGGKEKP